MNKNGYHSNLNKIEIKTWDKTKLSFNLALSSCAARVIKKLNFIAIGCEAEFDYIAFKVYYLTLFYDSV